MKLRAFLHAAWAPHSAWQLVLGLTLWSIWFVAIYSAMSVACAVMPAAPGAAWPTALSLALLALSAATALLLAAAAWRCWRALRCLNATRANVMRETSTRANIVREKSTRETVAASGHDGAERVSRHRFVAGLACVLHVTAAVATVFVGLPLLWLPPCL